MGPKSGELALIPGAGIGVEELVEVFARAKSIECDDRCCGRRTQTTALQCA